MKKLISFVVSILLLAGAIGSISSVSAANSIPPQTGHYCYNPRALDVPFYKASKEYYSGPDAAMEAIACINKVKPLIPSLTEWNYAQQMHTDEKSGTSSDAMLALLNSKQWKVKYKEIKSPSYDDFIDYIDQSFGKNVPVIIRVPFQSGEIANYQTQSHYICISSQMNFGGMHQEVIYSLKDPMSTISDDTNRMPDGGLYDEFMKDADPTLFVCI